MSRSHFPPLAQAALSDQTALASWLQEIDECVLLDWEPKWPTLVQELLAGGALPPHLTLRLEARMQRHLIARHDVTQERVEEVYGLVERAERHGWPAVRGDALLTLAALHGRTRLTADALQAIGQAEALFEQSGESHARQLQRLVEAQVLMDAEMFEELRLRLEGVLRDEVQLLTPGQHYKSLMLLGAALGNALLHAEALPIYERALALGMAKGSNRLPVRARFNTANTLVWLGELDRAELLLEEAARLMEIHGVGDGDAGFLEQNLALLAWKRGRHQDALAYFDQARAQAEAHGQLFLLSRALQRKAECASECGEIAVALQAQCTQVELLSNKLQASQKSHARSTAALLHHARLRAEVQHLEVEGSELSRQLADHHAALGQAMVQLRAEMAVRRGAEEALRQAHDALERKVEERTQELEQALRVLHEHEKQASVTRMVAGVAHELNTPLGTALLSCSTAQDLLREFSRRVLGNQLRRADLDRVCTQVVGGLDLVSENLERACALVRSFKELALESSGEEPESMDAVRGVREVLAASEREFRLRDIQLVFVSPESIRMRSHPAALKQVLAQLLQNVLAHAFDAPTAERRLRIELQGDAQNLHLSVTDTGRGLSEEALSRAFEPFYTTRLNSGTSGLGLAIAQRIVLSRLEGSISLHSEPGQGTQVRLKLPLRVRSAPRETHAGTPYDFTSTLAKPAP